MSSLAGAVISVAGQRSKEYTRLFSASNFANGIGPALAIVVFLATGNEWSEHALQACSAVAKMKHMTRCMSSADEP